MWDEFNFSFLSSENYDLQTWQIYTLSFLEMKIISRYDSEGVFTATAFATGSQT